MQPVISILLPAYNAAAYLGEAIDSMLGQTFGDFELLLINDGSTDRTAEIARSYADPRIRYIENAQNMGLIATLNKGIELAQGRYIARMDADDISLPERLARQFAFMEKHPSVGVCGTQVRTMEGRLSRYPLTDTDIRIELLRNCPFSHPSVMMRREVLRALPLAYNPDYRHAEDYELWARLMPVTAFANLPEALLLYRVHTQNVTHQHADTMWLNSWKMLQRVFSELGAPLSESEYQYYHQAATAHFEADRGYVAQVGEVLARIWTANNRSQMLPVMPFTRYLREKWWHVCYNASNLGSWVWGQYRQSPLRSNHWRQELQLKIKTWLGR